MLVTWALLSKSHRLITKMLTLRPSGLTFLSLAALLLVAACGIDTTIFGPPDGGTGGTGAEVGVGGGTGGDGGDDRPPAKSERVDLLLVVDNSRSMVDKQEILSLAVPNLLRSFTNPRCLDDEGRVVDDQPLTANDPCPLGSQRQFPPIADMNVGVVSSSLGGHGSDNCTEAADPTNDDRARLITRAPGSGTVNTYQQLGYLAWDPRAERDPAGETNQSNLETSLKGILLGTGQTGCGFEATLESWYRFLVEPDPHEQVVVQGGEAALVGTDQVLLEQRRAFLRPDSLLIIVSLSDENDCSIRDGGRFYLAGQTFDPSNPAQLYRLPRARAACAADPNDPCCRSCGQPPGNGCDTSQDQCETPLPPAQDDINLRCWQQKRRFGIDFLYPIERYLEGLTNPQVADRNGNLVPNPLFSDLNPNDELSTVRDERLVVMTSLIGVPWQDIARRNANGQPDLGDGRDAQGRRRGAFQSAEELIRNDTWGVILGDPDLYFSEEGAFPRDPHMLESIEPRSGVNPITGDLIAPPGASITANDINGHEYSIPGNDDLQYTCIFPLLAPRNCAATSDPCDCKSPGSGNPLCQDENDNFTTVQRRAKAYPGLRHLELLREMGNRGVVGSICPAQVDNGSRPDFGYVPFVRSLVESVAPILSP